MELGVSFREYSDVVLTSDGGKGLTALGLCAGEGGARPFPLPRTLPPPSLRPDMVVNKEAATWAAQRRKPTLGGTRGRR